MTGTNAGSPTGREPYGDTGPVVVVRVTPHQGGREGRPQGEGGQVTGYSTTGRHVKCRAPKRCWVSCVSAAGAACRVRNCTGNFSTRTFSCWPTGASTPTMER